MHTTRILSTPLQLLTALMLTATGACGQSLDYPDPPAGAATDTYFGVEVNDPFRALENMDDERTVRWAKEQDEMMRDFVTGIPVRPVLEERLLAMSKVGRIGSPLRAGRRIYYTATDPDSVMPVLLVSDSGSEPEVFYRTSRDFDLDSKPFRSFSPSPDGRYIVFHEGQGQSRWRHLRVMDAATREFLPDRIRGFYSGRGGVSWLRDGSGFFYTAYDEPEPGKVMETTVSDSRVYFHRVGQSQSDDDLVFSAPDRPDWLFWPRVTLDGRYLIITEASAPETRLFVKDLSREDSQVWGLATEADATYNFEGSRGSRFVIRTTRDAPNSRLMLVDVRSPEPSNWEELVAEQPDADLIAVSEIGERLVLRYTKDAKPLVRVHEFDGSRAYDVDLPSIGLIGGFADDLEPVTYYRFNSLMDPGSVYRFDIRSGESELFARPDLPFDPESFTLEQVFFESEDGTRVPMFIASRRDVPKRTSNPAFLYGYGAYKWSAFPWYQPHVLAWMEMGGVYALPGIRGGGEYGENWYQSGIRGNKQNAIDDFVAAARFLVSEGFTRHDLLVANGGSASGVIAGAALVQHPELFGAAMIDVPALDMLRYHHFGSGSGWVPEFGSPDDETQFTALRAYSPYHNISDGVCYPPTVTTVGELDDTTAPMHGYKFTAALQSAQSCPNPVTLKVMWGAGHATTYGNTPEQRASNAADLLSFLASVLELDGRGALPDGGDRSD